MTRFISLFCIILISLLTINAAPVPGAEPEPQRQESDFFPDIDEATNPSDFSDSLELALPQSIDDIVNQEEDPVSRESASPGIDERFLRTLPESNVEIVNQEQDDDRVKEVVPEGFVTNNLEEPEIEKATFTEVINTVYEELPAIADSNAVTSLFTSTRFVDEVTTTTVFCNPIPTTTITEQGTITEVITSSVVNEVLLTTTQLVPTTSTTFITSASTETSTASSTFTVTSISCETETVKVPATKTVVKTKTAFATEFVTVTEDNVASSTVRITVTKTATHTQNIFVTETVDEVDDSVEEQTPCDPIDTEPTPTPPCDENEPEIVNVDSPMTGYTISEDQIGADPSTESVPGYTTVEDPEIVNTDPSTGNMTPEDPEVVIVTEEPGYTTGDDPEIVDTDLPGGYETPGIASSDSPTGYEEDDPEIATSTEYTNTEEPEVVAESPSGYTILEEPDASTESAPEYTTEETLGDAYTTRKDGMGETDGTELASNTTSTENHDPLAQALGTLLG